MKFVIFHGAFGSPDRNWFPQLKEKLELLNQHVIVPAFPVDDWGAPLVNQNLHNWIKTFEKILRHLKREKNYVLLGTLLVVSSSCM